MTTKKKTSKKKAAKKPVAVKQKPRQTRLPGMEDAGIRELENQAENYADVRDQRMELTRQESQLSVDLLAMMKKHGKTEYHHAEVHVWVKVTEEKVKVKIGELPAKATSFEPDEEDAGIPADTVDS